MNRSGFSTAEKNNMLISAETLYGLRMTCKLMHSGNIINHYLQWNFFFYFMQVIS